MSKFMSRRSMSGLYTNDVLLLEFQEKLNEATSYLLKAINIAKKSKMYANILMLHPLIYTALFRYHFLVFNASVYMWQIIRPYQRSGHRQIITRPLASVVKALDEVNEQDYKWRLELMMSVIVNFSV